MASLLAGYSYDIFISYRQKDNRHDGWVSEFVENLKGELEATFKEEISVYFDINPHDGLLETDDVGASLKDKLKCLIFIPILSRTYCDPNSFAWEHEFKAFIEQVSRDDFGLKVRLPNGNIGSRVLPIRIHDLDSSDIKLCEATLGSVLRGIEFIYKSAGVNRPLRFTEDKPHENLSNTIYRDQINKVALAIKDVIMGLKAKAAIAEEKRSELEQKEGDVVKRAVEVRWGRIRYGARRFLSWRGIVIAAIIIGAVVLYPRLSKQGKIEMLQSKGRIDVAIMPFQNLTNDSTWNVWQSGIQDIIVSSLSSAEELRIRQPETVNGLMYGKGLRNYASLTPSLASVISRDLDTKVFVYGSINRAGNTIRLNAQLINSKTKETYKSYQIDGSPDNILVNIDSLSKMIKGSLLIARLQKGYYGYGMYHPPTSSPEAFRLYLLGEQERSRRNYDNAKEMFSQALAIDSNFYQALLMLAVANTNQGDYSEARKWSEKAFSQRDKMSTRYKLLTESNHAFFFATPYDQINSLREYLKVDDQFPGTYYDIGRIYNDLEQYDKAIPEFEKTLKLYDKYNIKPWWIFNYSLLGWAYYKTGQYNKLEKLYKKADEDFPDDALIVHMRIILSLIKKDTVAADEYIKKYVSLRKENLWSDASIAYNLGEIYYEAGYMDKAEEYHRQEYALDPENYFRISNLGWFLIQSGIDVEEGMRLNDTALEKAPENFQYYFLERKGWGLHMLGKDDEALEILKKSRDNCPYYKYSVYSRIEEVEKSLDSGHI